MSIAFFQRTVGTARRQITRWLPWFDRHRSARQFIKFCLVGASNVAVYFTCYLLLTRLWHWYFLVGSITSFVLAVTWSFYWNRRWTFGVSGGAARSYHKFVLTNIVSGTVSSVVLYVLVEGYGWYDIAANVVTIGFTTAWNFTVTKFWAFRS